MIILLYLHYYHFFSFNKNLKSSYLNHFIFILILKNLKINIYLNNNIYNNIFYFYKLIYHCFGPFFINIHIFFNYQFLIDSIILNYFQ